MSFVAELSDLPLAALLEKSCGARVDEVRQSLAKNRLSLDDFARLISPAAGACLEAMCQQAHAVTIQRFGRVMRLFAPLYLSNECVDSCEYCGFSRRNSIARVTLNLEEVVREAGALKQDGFRNLLLVAGEHPKWVTPGYLRDCIQALRHSFPSISLEIGPLDAGHYRDLVQAGAEGLVIYQETYDRQIYAEMHPSGPKRNYDWRIETPERAYAAGFRRLGIGALYGLADWRKEALCLAAHACYLLRHCWKSYLTISLPRLRPNAGGFQCRAPISDRELVQLTAALRLFLPDAGLVLSTRERAPLRDGLIKVGITLMSAGSHTEPGGYTGAGHENVHSSNIQTSLPSPGQNIHAATISDGKATEQFNIADARSAREIAVILERMGYEPVWKDWDAALSA